MNLGIIGYGNIGELLVQNILNLNKHDFNKLYISNRHIAKIEFLRDIDGVICTDSNIEVSKNCEKIIICVETPDFFCVIDEIKPHINKKSHIIYCCAGIDIKERKNKYPLDMTCIIPTIASTYDGISPKKGVSLIYHDENLKEDNKKYINELFSQFSEIKIVENYDELAILTLATSCMPAFIALTLDKLSEKLELNSNLKKEEFMKLLCETSKSTSQIMLEEKYTSDELISKVATKNGITEKGLIYLDDELKNICQNLINIII